MTKDGGNIVYFTAAGTLIDVSEAAGTYTFTSSGGTAGSDTALAPIAGIVVPASTTLSISSVLASGVAFTGAGTALVIADVGGEDLTAFTGTGVTVFELTTGQNYTLTAAQAAIGRIGAGGTAGVLTDAGTITVDDTLANLGAGVAAALKTAGADSVVATAATGADISAVDVAGIDSIVLGAGQNYTMTAAQAALVDGTAGAQAVTLTTLATGVLAATVESFILGDFTNDVTLGDPAQNVTGPAGNVTTLTIGGNAATGIWALANGADVLVATTGANIAGVNGGAATTAENLTLTGAITMAQAQHEALTIAAGTGTDAVTIATGGAVTGQSGVESYTVSSGGSNTLAVLTGATDINGSASNATTVNVGGNTVSGTWALAHTADEIVATNGANISGVNLGGATTAEKLTLADGITMTQAQHAGLAVTADGGTDSITITNGGAVAAQASIETYNVGGAASNVTVNAATTGLIVNGAAGFATTVTVDGKTVTGTYALANGADVLVAMTGGDISGANTTSVESLTMSLNVTMTAAQYIAFNTGGITAAGATDRIILTGSLNGGQTLNAAVENFTLAAGPHNVVLGASGQSINATALAASSALTLSGDFAAEISLSMGNLLGGTANGGLLVTGGAGANTITTGAGTDIVLASDGADMITGGDGVDTLNGESGNDSFFYGSMAQFLTGGLVVDQIINGGGDTDAVVINADAVVLTALSDLTRMTNVEQIKAQTQSATLHAHSIVISSNALLGGVNTIDLSGDTKSTSTGTIDFTGVTNAMTLKGVGAGVNTITGGSGADALFGGTGNDLFLFGSAAAAAADTVEGGGGTDTVLFRSTAGETLVVDDHFIAGLSYLVTTNSTAVAAGTTSENIDASTHTLGGVKLTGNGGNNILTGSADADTLVGGGGIDTVRGGAGNDTINVSGTTTLVFEATASANGVDALTNVNANSKFKFSDFLVTGVGMQNAVVDATNGGVRLDLTGGDHIGVRYASSTLISANIVTSFTAGIAGQVLVADNGKAVVFSSSSNISHQDAIGSIYYVEDVDATGAQDFIVTLVGTMTGSSTLSISELAASNGFI
ncbi:hypothetical protein EEB15_26770 [Ramlibacter sp. WS9]|nr:hypothetical protein EEB15_26770 [Ramlibacter sp. WS9]